MTIPIENLNYKILGQLLHNPDISELELELLIHTCIQIISGNRTTESLLKVYTDTNNKYLNVIEYLVNKRYKENEI